MDCSLTDNESRHIQKTQIAHLRFVTGLGLDLKSPTLMQLPETDTSQPIQLQPRRQAGKCLTKSEVLRAFFRLAIQSRFLPLHLICSLEVFLSVSAAPMGPHTSHSQHTRVSPTAYLGYALPKVRAHPVAISFPAIQMCSVSLHSPSRVLHVSPIAKDSNHYTHIAKYLSYFQNYLLFHLTFPNQ